MSERRQVRVKRVLQLIANGEHLKEAAITIGGTYLSLKQELTVFYQIHGLDNMNHAIAKGFREGWIT